MSLVVLVPMGVVLVLTGATEVNSLAQLRPVAEQEKPAMQESPVSP